jgi:hypothetical protein
MGTTKVSALSNVSVLPEIKNIDRIVEYRIPFYDLLNAIYSAIIEKVISFTG